MISSASFDNSLTETRSPILSRRNNLSLAIIVFVTMMLSLSAVSKVYARATWYEYYKNGIDYYEKGQWQRALNEFRAAVSLEFEEKKNKRTYGMHFIKYFPHRYMADCYYNLGDTLNAQQEIELSLAFQSSREGQEIKNKISSQPPPVPVVDANAPAGGITPSITEEDKEYFEQLEKLRKEKEDLELKRAEEREKERKRIEALEEKLKRQREIDRKKGKYYSTYGKIPAGMLTYDPNQVTQVGSRLSIAVMKFTYSGSSRDLSNDVLNEMVTHLYSLGGRFNIIEREKVQKIIDEQIRSQAGQIDEKTAIKAGKIIGVDAVLMGSIAESGDGSIKIWSRLINTETGQLITAQDAFAEKNYPEDISKSCLDLSIKLYNDLPLVEGYIVQVGADDHLIVDLGLDRRMKKDMQVVLFREGDKIKHPVTDDVIFVKKVYLGEAVFTQLQESSALAKVIYKEKGEKFEVGDRVVVK
ncbi:MAG: hypothetical protein GF307_14130 [candidate division Zixibacteria bacterium]|nr:hypothetical protein [candidate division Zixibacteria bacterium]